METQIKTGKRPFLAEGKKYVAMATALMLTATVFAEGTLKKTIEATPEDGLSILEIAGYTLMIAAVIAIAWFLSMGGGIKKKTAASHGPVHHPHDPYRRIKPKKTS